MHYMQEIIKLYNYIEIIQYPMCYSQDNLFRLRNIAKKCKNIINRQKFWPPEYIYVNSVKYNIIYYHCI